MNEVIREFLLETHENLQQLDLDLVTLETDPTERETLARVFRTLHTIKGTAGFLGLMKLQALAHAAESLLTRLTSGELTFDKSIASGLLATVDAIRKILEEVEKTEHEGDGEFVEVIRMLEDLRTVEARKPRAAPRPAPTPPPPAPAAAPKRPERAALPIEHPAILADDEPTSARFEKPEAPDELPPMLTPDLPRSTDRNGDDDDAPPPSSRRTPATIIVAESPLLDAAPEPRVSAVSDSSIRVDVGLLDTLMSLVGELVLARNQIAQFSNTQDDPAFLSTVQRLNVLTTELQARVTKTRMQPIGNTWSKFPRLVRDLSVACGKQVRFEMEGRDTELDKTIVEAIRDPLTHMIRNAVDHGIEAPALRKARGKPADGRLSLRAFHDGGKVVIEVADDGGGVNLQRVRAKAIDAELITVEQAEEMTERGLLNLIFLPGFTTADKVTHFSGRGVGMDVVRSNVEKIGGTVDIDSWTGRGTTIRIKIPRTLAIIPALIISSGGDFYAIPQISVQEMIRLEGEAAQAGIEYIGEAPVHRLRGNLLPVIFLNQTLNVEAPYEFWPDHDVLNIVVLLADERAFGLVVDDIHDTAEIVVKPLQQRLKGIGGFAGATIMGDGTVALILDVLGLAQLGNVVSDVQERGLDEKPISESDAAGEKMAMIVFKTPDDRRIAVPMAQVGRLEEYPRGAVDRVGNQYALRYHGQILPLLDVADVLESAHASNNGSMRARCDWSRQGSGDEPVQFVVHGREGKRIGLVLGEILDIVDASLASRARVHQPCVLFSVLIHDRITEVLDIEGIVRLADPEFYLQPALAGEA